MKQLLLLLLTHLLSIFAIANVKLPKIFGNNMVLQRNKPIPIWGWANPGEKIAIAFNRQTVKTQAGKDGKWKILLNMEAAGGPFRLSVSGKNDIVLNNILVGEVWLCSGQSNMEMTVSNGRNAEEEIGRANFPQIRHIKLPNIISATPAEDLIAGEWQLASPASAGNFSAVGYFFAKKLYEELKVPIGLINASWGGSMIETWISREALEQCSDFKGIFQKISFEDINAMNEKLYQNTLQEIEAEQGNVSPVSGAEEWKTASFDDSKWKKIALPVNFDQSGLAKFDGQVWFRKIIELDKASSTIAAVINLSTIDDMDETYINGQLVGSSNAYNISRQYTIAPGILKGGRNVIAIRVTDNNGNGGFFGKPSELNITTAKQIIPLAGSWWYKIESLKKNPVNPNSYPSLLYNSMIHPVLSYGIKGALWYQGETNAERAFQYRTAFPVLINDWRNRFNQGDFPFYFVQLASYRASNGNSNKGSTWAELREAQSKTLSLPNTGMTVTMDIGESDDIHPKNKQDVGYRLAAIALKRLYNKNIVCSGPVYQSMKIDGNKVIVSFSNIDSGYFVNDKYSYIKGFEIAGADKKFYFAKASLENGKVMVQSDSVPSPVAVRYGWADDMPEVNLYNKQLFPAVPFRSDNWKSITEEVKYAVIK